MEKVVLSFEKLYETTGGRLANGMSIEKMEEDGNLYYDLHDTDGRLVACEMEEAEVLSKINYNSGIPDIIFSSDILGSYDRTNFVGGIPLDVFTDDGWECTWYGGIFVSFENSKYEDCKLYLYGLKEHMTLSDLMMNGVYGYECDITDCDTNIYPNMVFHGITWGASEEDIIAAYGNPDEKHTLSNGDYKYLVYKSPNGTTMEFKVYSNNEKGINGLTGISVVNWSLIRNNDDIKLLNTISNIEFTITRKEYEMAVVQTIPETKSKATTLGNILNLLPVEECGVVVFADEDEIKYKYYSKNDILEKFNPESIVLEIKPFIKDSEMDGIAIIVQK